MERRHQLTIIIKGRPEFLAGQSELSTQRREKDEYPVLDLPALPVLPSAELPARTPFIEQLVQYGAASPDLESPNAETSVQLDLSAAVADVGAEAESIEAEESSGEETGKKKRKRRRRKKKGGENLSADEAAAQEGPLEAAATEEEPELVGEEAALSGEAGEKKKKKRRRKKKKSGETVAAGEPSAEIVSSEMPAENERELESETEELATGEQGEHGEERKKKRRRRRKKKPALATEVGADQAVHAPPASIEMAESPTELPPTGNTEAKTAGRSRGGRKKVEKTGEGATDAASLMPENSLLLSAPGEPVHSAPAGRSRGRRVSKPATGSIGDIPVREETPIGIEPGTAADSAAEAKPARQQRPKRPARGKQAPDVGTQEPVAVEMERPEKQEAPAAVNTVEEKPKRRPPRKKAPVSKKPDDKSTPE